MGRARKPNVPGSIYIRGGRYWWDVRLPGERQHRSRPLIPTGADLATSDYNTAVEVARAEYEEALVGHTIRPGQEADVPTGPMTIIELLARYKAHASTYYVDESGTPTQEVQNIDLATRPLREFCPTDLVQDFGPRRLKEVRQYMASKMRTVIVDGQPQEVTRLCRKEINRRINSIRRMFRWGVSEQLVPQGIYYAVKALEPLKKGRARVRETKKVRPIEEKWVRLTMQSATPTLAAMIELQLLTGMRPGEVCAMRACDLTTVGDVWLYTMAEHKTAYLEDGDVKIIPFGPRAQAIIKPRLAGRRTDAFLFQPKETQKERFAKMRKERKTKVQPSQRFRKKAEPEKTPGDFFDTRSYRTAIFNTIERANKKLRALAKEAAKDGNGEEPVVQIPHWHPHQIRHTAGTVIRQKADLDTARAMLGHRSLGMTDLYAELDLQKAIEFAKLTG